MGTFGVYCMVLVNSQLLCLMNREAGLPSPLFQCSFKGGGAGGTPELCADGNPLNLHPHSPLRVPSTLQFLPASLGGVLFPRQCRLCAGS